MTILSSTCSVLGLCLSLAASTSFRYPQQCASTLIDQGAFPLDTPRHSLVGEWELTYNDNGVGSGVKLTFDSVNMYWAGSVYPYSIEDDSLRIFTKYQVMSAMGTATGTSLN